MSEWCLLSLFGQQALCISMWIVIGVIMAIVGILIALYIPIGFGRKIGLYMTTVGLALAIGVPLVGHLWETSMIFQMSVYTILTLFLIMVILSPDQKIIPGKKK
jgi:uncharacterized membrane protein YoaK (UPF0700 family)